MKHYRIIFKLVVIKRFFLTRRRSEVAYYFNVKKKKFDLNISMKYLNNQILLDPVVSLEHLFLACSLSRLSK